jgi:hypothetical protein
MEEFHFGVLLDTVDEIDSEINMSTAAMVMDLNVKGFILHSSQELFDAYFLRIIELATNLQKVNGHRRKYLAEEKRFIDEYRVKISKSEQNTHSSTTAVNLSAELDGVLNQFKASLDTLSKTFKQLFNIDFHTWGKKIDKTDGKKKSGQVIVEALKNQLPDEDKIKCNELIDYITKNLDWATAIVLQRDEVNHYGGLKNLSPITYNYKTKEIIPQIITHSDGRREKVSDYLERVTRELVIFVVTVLVLSIKAKAPGGDMAVRRIVKDGNYHFEWIITE